MVIQEGWDSSVRRKEHVTTADIVTRCARKGALLHLISGASGNTPGTFGRVSSRNPHAVRLRPKARYPQGTRRRLRPKTLDSLSPVSQNRKLRLKIVLLTTVPHISSCSLSFPKVPHTLHGPQRTHLLRGPLSTPRLYNWHPLPITVKPVPHFF